MSPNCDGQKLQAAEQPFDLKDEREQEAKRVRELRPVLEELDEWRKKSLTASIRI